MDRYVKILAIAPYQIYPPNTGGQKAIYLFYKYLSKELPVTLISTKQSTFPEDFQVRFLPLLGTTKFRYLNIFLVFKLNKIIRNNQYTHLILEHPYYGWLGLLIKIFCSIQLVIRSHNIESIRFKSIGKWWWPVLWNYEQFIYRCAEKVFFITDEDKDFALKHFDLDEIKCFTVPYGTELQSVPAMALKDESRKYLSQKHSIDSKARILFFNGTLDYKPNQDALDFILNILNPALFGENQFEYKIIITGGRLPPQYQKLENYASLNIIYAGFVKDIERYYQGADLFLNPVNDGGGVKTKLVEALGNNLTVVSSPKGAYGVPLQYTGNKLILAETEPPELFTRAILNADLTENIPGDFYKQYYCANVAKTIKTILN